MSFDTVSCRSLAGSGSCAEGVGSSHMGCELHQLSAPVSAFSHLTSSKCIKMHCDIIFRYGFVMVCPKMLHIDIYIILIYIIHRCARMKKARMMINHDKPSNLRYTSFNQTHMLIGFSCSCSGMSCNIN